MTDTLTSDQDTDVSENADDEASTEPQVLVTTEDVRELFRTKGSDRLKAQMEQDIVNPVELARVLGIRPQMVYNYIKKGMLANATGRNDTQKITIRLSVALEWAAKYLDKKAQKQARIERELAGE